MIVVSAVMIVTAAAVAAASMTFAVVMVAAAVAVAMVMMAAGGVGIVGQSAVQQCSNRVISAAGDPGEEQNTGLSQCHLRTGADAAADEGFYAVLGQQSGQRAVTAAIGADDFGADKGASLHSIKLKLLGMTKMLENLSVFVGYCNFHKSTSL